MILAAAAVLALDAVAPGPLRSVEERAGDALWRLSSASAPADEVERRFVVVDIDEASLAKLGPWPWPRERLA